MLGVHEPPAFGNYMVKDVVHIVLPKQIDWALTQPGFLVVYTLLFILFSFVLWRVYRRWKENAYRRYALREATRCAGDTDNLLALLRQTAMRAYPDHDLATLLGDSWWEFLNSCSRQPLFSENLRDELEQRYHKKINVTPELELAIRRWIREHQRGANVRV